jgi:hypothetical protein
VTEAGRVCLLVSKQFAALRGGDAALWTQMVAVRARAFQPASVFFRGPRTANDSSLSRERLELVWKRMTELFAVRPRRRTQSLLRSSRTRAPR